MQYKKVVNSKVFKDPISMFANRRLLLDKNTKNLCLNAKLELKNKKLELVKIASNLDALSPLKTLTRGYSIVENKEGKIIKSTKDVKAKEDLLLTLSDGKVEVSVKWKKVKS